MDEQKARAPEEHFPGPRTVVDMLAAWDAGRSIWSVEMGGLGPGYEQAIQVAAIELVRDNQGKPFPANDDEYFVWGADTFGRIDDKLGGLSGAMAGAAKHIALQFLRNDYGGALDKIRTQAPDRMIQVSNVWPKVDA